MKKLYKEVVLKEYDGLVSYCDILNESGGFNYCIDCCEFTAHIIYPVVSKESAFFQHLVEKFKRTTDKFVVVYDIDGCYPVEELDNIYICVKAIQPLLEGIYLDRSNEWVHIECNYTQSLIIDRVLEEIEKKYVDK